MSSAPKKTRASRGARSKVRNGTDRPGRNPAESPIAWLYGRRDAAGNPLISEAEFNAGERLRADFWFAEMQPSVTQSWSPMAGAGGNARAAPGAGVEQADNVIAAGERVRRALAAVGGDLAGILIDVCCHLKGLEAVERQAGWPRRSAKIVLSLALRRLALHYGLTVEGSAPRRSVVRHWGAPGYRPSGDTEEGEDAESA